jgi:DNA-binding FadR family transcriptional regulator
LRPRQTPTGTLGQWVAQDLERQIGLGEWLPGDRLPIESELMTLYGVGRNTVREAVQHLVALGIVDVRPRRGVTVLSSFAETGLASDVVSALLSHDAAQELHEMRSLIESEAAGLAARRGTDSTIAVISEAHDDFCAAIGATGFPWEEDLQFHLAVVLATGNSVLPQMMEAIADLLERDAALLAPADGALAQQTVHRHGAILEAIRAGDEDVARESMHDHIETLTAERLRLHGRATGSEDTQEAPNGH